MPIVATLLDDLRAAGHELAGMVFALHALDIRPSTARLLNHAEEFSTSLQMSHGDADNGS